MPTIQDIFSRFGASRSSNHVGEAVPEQIYGAVVAQARLPVFYERYGIDDSVTGRFDLLCLHVFLFSHRLASERGTLARELGQDVFDAFVDDVDRALRQLGIGDNTVPKRKKRLVHGFYAMIEEFSEPIDAEDANGLRRMVARRFHGGAETSPAELMTHYVLRANRMLRDCSFEQIAAGRIEWPDPQRTI